MTIGTRIRHWRLKAEKTQRKLSESSGLTVSYLSRLENGRITPSIRTLEKLAKALEMPVTAFFETEQMLDAGDHCPVSLSGQCILEHAYVGRGRPPVDEEGYSPVQLEALRQCNYLLQQGDDEIQATLALQLRALYLLHDSRKKAREENAAVQLKLAAGSE